MGLVVVVQAVAAQASQQGDTFHLRYISKVYTCGITLELDVEPELGLLDRRSQIVDVLHHQRPVGLLRIIRRILQRLDEQGLTGIGMVAGKLAHPVGTPAIGVLEGYGQHLVGLQAGLQRDISQGLVQRVLRRTEQPGGRQLLIVHAARKLRVEHR